MGILEWVQCGTKKVMEKQASLLRRGAERPGSVHHREEKAWGRSHQLCRHLKGWSKKDGSRLFSVVFSNRMSDSEHKLKRRKSYINVRKKKLPKQSVVSILGGIQNLMMHILGQHALVWTGSWTRWSLKVFSNSNNSMISRESFIPPLFRVILRCESAGFIHVSFCKVTREVILVSFMTTCLVVFVSCDRCGYLQRFDPQQLHGFSKSFILDSLRGKTFFLDF